MFANVVFKVQEPAARRVILTLIDEDRQGEPVDKILIKTSVNV